MNQSTNRSVISRKAGIAHWRVPAVVKHEVLRFLEELALGKVNRDFKVSEARQAKYLDLLRQPLEFFNKKTEQLKVADVERFEQALTTDQLISRRKQKPYAFAYESRHAQAVQNLSAVAAGRGQGRGSGGLAGYPRALQDPG